MIQSSLEGCGVVSSGIFAKPLEIEIGCGKARFLLERARENPNIHFVGVEKVSKWARIAGQRAERGGLGNLHIVKGDARDIVKYDLPSSSTSAFHIYFPDPWPKRRHRKRRLLTWAFLELLHDRLEAGGVIEYATDFEDYFDEIRSFAVAQKRLWKDVRERVNAPLLSGAEGTNYAMKYIREGRTIFYLEMRKCG